MPRVHLVHGGEVVEVLQEDRRLDEILDGASRRLENRRQVTQGLLGLLGDVPLDHRVTRFDTELAGDEDELADPDRLVVRGALKRCRRGLGADDDLLHAGLLDLGWAAAERQPRKPRDQISARSIDAPSARSRSSIRS